MDTMKEFSDKSPIVDKCCCCIDLRSAAKVLGILCILGSFWPTVLVFLIVLPGHICWFCGIFKEQPKFLLIGSAFHACIYGLDVYASVYYAMDMGIESAIFSGILDFCLMTYFMIVEISFYKSMTASATKPNNVTNA